MNLSWHDKHVKMYDQQIAKKIAGYDLLYDLTNHFISKHHQPIQKMLIIGAGGGQELYSFSAVLPNCCFTAVDSSEPMLARAKERMEQIGNHVEYVLSNWQDYEGTTQFDAASCLLVLNFIEGIEQKTQFLKKIYDSLKPGAVLFIATMMNDDEYFMKLHLSAWKNYMLQQKVANEHATKFEETYEKSYHLLREGELISLLSSCGFTSVGHYFQSFLLAGYICIKGDSNTHQ
ncbi:class I SAM-dependent methyltransferase [Bacillus sp. FJAT-50079]|uniref:class I SAM-dependent methyltransferase n=1 Tax=Bacillus sp. FJAT-50079 TaxID=2833577 RepID=UPI001BC94EEA|nr:class I SAM-dependent methyltransferase [Bacillus sp. FJAT-50079]MBS4207103.1 class I SAM-dependent methyltransferase [Bacillus sp. FJAT-50079]